MDKSRPSFQVRRQPEGERLVWRHPGADARVSRQMAAAGISVLGNSLTIGYYRQMDGAVAFVPLPTPAAIAALGIEMVQARICEDLQIRLRGT